MKNKKNTKCPICGWDINDKLPKLKVLRAVRPFDKLGNDKLPGDCRGQLRKVTLKECARLSRRSAASQIKALKKDNEARANAVIAIIPGAGGAERRRAP